MENEVDPPAHLGSEAIGLRWTLKDIAAKRSRMINKQHLAQLLSWVSSRAVPHLPLPAISISASAQLAWRRHCIISARGRPPLWRIDIEMLGIVRQQSLLAQPLCLPGIAERWRCNRLAICEAEFVGDKVTIRGVPRRSAGHGRPRS